MFLKDNQLDVNTYLDLRSKVGWKPLTKEQATMAIKNSLLTVVAYDKDAPIGMGRIVGDGAVICYIQDLIVVPEYQGQGIGQAIIDSLIDYVKEIKSNPIAAAVKLADLKHNSDLTRLDVIDEKAINRAEKYKKAIRLLSK